MILVSHVIVGRLVSRLGRRELQLDTRESPTQFQESRLLSSWRSFRSAQRKTVVQNFQLSNKRINHCWNSKRIMYEDVLSCDQFCVN